MFPKLLPTVTMTKLYQHVPLKLEQYADHLTHSRNIQKMKWKSFQNLHISNMPLMHIELQLINYNHLFIFFCKLRILIVPSTLTRWTKHIQSVIHTLSKPITTWMEMIQWANTTWFKKNDNCMTKISLTPVYCRSYCFCSQYAVRLAVLQLRKTAENERYWNRTVKLQKVNGIKIERSNCGKWIVSRWNSWYNKWRW